MEKAISLGTALRNARKARGYSLRELAEITGMPNGQLSQIENDLRQPKFVTIAPIAEALGISLDTLARETGFQERARGVPQSAREQLVQRSEIMNIKAKLEKLRRRCADLQRVAAAIQGNKGSVTQLGSGIADAARDLAVITGQYDLLRQKSGLSPSPRRATAAKRQRQLPGRRK